MEELIHSISIYSLCLTVSQAPENNNNNKKPQQQEKTVNKTEKIPDEDTKSLKVNTVLEIT